jgi:hypothetical protein
VFILEDRDSFIQLIFKIKTEKASMMLSQIYMLSFVLLLWQRLVVHWITLPIVTWIGLAASTSAPLRASS